jgi:hypothetical protein
MLKIFRSLFLILIITIFISCTKDASFKNIITSNNDTTTIYGKWQWEYDIHDIITGATNYTSSPSSTTQLVLTIDTGNTYSVILNNSTITTGTFSDTSSYYYLLTFQNSFNISNINFIMANNTQSIYRVSATRLFMEDYEPSSAMDSTLIHVFKLAP